MHRRSVLGAVGSGLTVAVGGCLGGSGPSGPTTLTVRLDATGAIDQFEQLQLGVGKVTLTPAEGEPTSFRLLEEYDLTRGPTTLVDGKSLPAGTYTELSMTATVDRRELPGGGSPQVALDDEDLRTELADPLELAGGTTDLTATLSVSEGDDVPYRMALSGVTERS